MTLTFLSFIELRSSESDFLLGLLLPDEDIMGCRRFQSFDEFTTSLASFKKLRENLILVYNDVEALLEVHQSHTILRLIVYVA